MANISVASLLVDTLVAAGVKRVYGLAGDSLNGITESIRSRDDIQWIPVRHEETAAFAAGAEAHLTGNLTVCAGSCGPGNLHLINGLMTAPLWSKSSYTGRNSCCLRKSALIRWQVSVSSCSKRFSAGTATRFLTWQK